jgi:RNA polymerase sigma-70 factor (ECF subfamily)
VLRNRPGATDLRLLRQHVAAGSAPAVTTEAAWHAFHGRLRAFALRQVRTAADADDVVQTVFLRLHRSLPRLRDADRVGAWLFQSARNAIVDHYRAPSRHRETLSGDARDLEDIGGAAPEADERAATRAEAAGCVRGMVDRLAESDRRAIDLVELRGMTQGAAAAAEGLTLSGMKARVQRARRRLKAALEECCRFVLDARAGVMEASPTSGSCATSGSTSRPLDAEVNCC